MSELLQLTSEEMENVENSIRSLFPNHDQLFILHEIESKYCHSDIGILFTSNKDSGLPVILFTLGCSAAKVILDDTKYQSFEMIYKLPRSAFADDLSEDMCSICGRNPRMSIEIVKEEYRYIIYDLLKLSKLPALTGEYYGNGHTIEINSDRSVGLLSFNNSYRKCHDFNLYHIVYLNKNQLEQIIKSKDLERQEILYSILRYNDATLND